MTSDSTDAVDRMNRWTLTAFVLVAPWGELVPLPGGPSLLSAAAGAATAAFLLRLGLRPIRKAPLRAVAPVAAILALVWLFSLWSPRNDVLTGVALLALGLVWVLALADLGSTPEGMRRLMGALWIGGSILASTVVAEYLTNTAAYTYRFVDETLNSNSTATYLAFAAVAAWHVAIHAQRRTVTWLTMATLPLIAGAAILTGSRSGFVGLLVLAGYALVTGARRSSHTTVGRGMQITALVTVAAASVALVVQQAPEDTVERVVSALQPRDVAQQEDEIRPQLWATAVDAWEDRLYLGMGVGGSRVNTDARGHETAVHSTYLQVGLEASIFGLMALVFFLLQTWRRSVSAPRSHRLAALAVLGVWAASATTHSLLGWTGTWLAFGLAAGSAAWQSDSRMADRERIPPVGMRKDQALVGT